MPPAALRIVIVVIAALEILWFSRKFFSSLRTLSDAHTHGLEAAFVIGRIVVAPLLALAGGGLGIAGARLRLAAILLCAAAAIYLLPVLVFLVVIAIYGK